MEHQGEAVANQVANQTIAALGLNDARDAILNQVYAGSISLQQANAELMRLAGIKARIALNPQTEVVGGISQEQAAAEVGRLQSLVGAHTINFNDWVAAGADLMRFEQATGQPLPQSTDGLTPQAIQALSSINPRAVGITKEGNSTTSQQIGEVREIAAAQVGETQGVQAATINPTISVQGSQLGNAAQMQAAQIGPASQALAAQISPIERFQGAQLGDASLITNGGAEARARQVALIQQLEAQARGDGPSLAAVQLRAAQDRATKQQQAIIASRPDLSAALALRLASNQRGDLEAQTNQEVAQARVAEILQAREQLNSILGQTRQQDIGVEAANVAAVNQFGLTQAGLAQEAGLATQQQANAARFAQAELQQQAALGNRDALNQLLVQRAQLQQQAAAANQAAINQRAVEQGEINLRASLANQLAENTRAFNQANLNQNASAANADLAYKRATTNADLLQKARLANQAEFNNTGRAQGQIYGGIEQTNISGNAQTTAASSAAGATIAAAAEAARARIEAERIAQQTAIFTNTQDNLTALGGQEQSGGAQFENTTTGAYNQAQANEGEVIGGVIQGVAGVGAAGVVGGGSAGGSPPSTPKTVSDRRQKKEIRLGDKQIETFLDNLGAYLYRYKNPSKDGEGERLGVMAQDMEGSKAGRLAILETPRGKAIDIKKGIGLALAAQANLNKRMKKIEGGKNAR